MIIKQSSALILTLQRLLYNSSPLSLQYNFFCHTKVYKSNRPIKYQDPPLMQIMGDSVLSNDHTVGDSLLNT